MIIELFQEGLDYKKRIYTVRPTRHMSRSSITNPGKPVSLKAIDVPKPGELTAA